MGSVGQYSRYELAPVRLSERVDFVAKDLNVSKEKAKQYIEEIDKFGIGSWKDLRDSSIIKEYIQKSPSYKGTIYRGINVTEQVYSTIVNSGTVSMDGITSWAGDRLSAEQFTQGEGKRIMFVMKDAKNSAGISHIAPLTTESEVLVYSKSKYKITEIEKRSQITYIHIK